MDDSDDAIRSTNEDASSSRASAAAAGYMPDRYVLALARRPRKKGPLINRGTWLRCGAIDAYVRRFLDLCRGLGRPAQVVSLGAGFETRYFALRDAGLGGFAYFEVDFPEITSAKVRAMTRARDVFGPHLGTDFRIEKGGTELHTSGGLHCIAGDLRQWDEQVVPSLHRSGFSNAISTLFVAECVLIYLEPAYSARMLEWSHRELAAAEAHVAWLNYEQILPHDSFGQVMLSHLAARRIALAGIDAFPTAQAQRERFLAAGAAHAQVHDLWEIWQHAVTPESRTRIDAIEMLDEVEEFRLLMQHYCLVRSIRSPEGGADAFCGLDFGL